MKKVFILNKPFEGSYADKEGNFAHEIINYFRADNGKIYIYNNPLGHCPANIDVDDSKDYKLEYMFLTKKASISKEGSEFELTHLIKIKRCLHHESTHDDEEKMKKSQDVVKKVIKSEIIKYGGETLDSIFGEGDKSLYVTFEAENVYKPKSAIRVKTPGYRFQRNKGYVFEDTNKAAFEVLEKYTDLQYWDEITDQIARVNIQKPSPRVNTSFLDLILKVGSEECYTNMLYSVLNFGNTIKLFAQNFAMNAYLDSDQFEVKREWKVKGGRMDICAYTDNQRIVIENKVFSGLNGIDNVGNQTQLTNYYNWAAEKQNPLCFIICPEFRREEIESEMESEMRDKYIFVTYADIAKFINKLDKENYFNCFLFKCYIKDIISSFNKYRYLNKSELFEQFFLEAIETVKAKPKKSEV